MLCMAKLIKINKTNPKAFAPIPTECIVCGEAGLHFDGNIKYHVCNKCLRCIDDHQSLILEAMYEDDSNITISSRSMIIDKSIVKATTKIIFLEHNNFSELYNQYKLKMN